MPVLDCLTVSLMGPAAPAPLPERDPAGVREELEVVLTRPEFNEAYRADIFGQLGRWLLSCIESLQSSMFEFGYGEKLQRLSYVLMWVILVVSVVSLIYWGLRSLRHRRARIHTMLPEPTGVALANRGELKGALEVRDGRARALLASWRELLRQMEQRRFVPSDPCGTNREYILRFAQGAPASAALPPLLEMAQVYDEHIFGSRPITGEAWNRWRRLMETVSLVLGIEVAVPAFL
jgi:hypothetical protein